MKTENKKEKNARIQREFQQRRKEEAIKHYGGKCFICGEKRIDTLTVDSPLPKRQIFYNLKKLGYPKGIKVICFNCGFFKKK